MGKMKRRAKLRKLPKKLVRLLARAEERFWSGKGNRLWLKEGR